MTSLYVAEYSNGKVKIGVSNNVTRRVASIATSGDLGPPVRVKQFEVPDARVVEQIVLTTLQEHKTSGEWFTCDFSTVVNTAEQVIATSAERLAEELPSADAIRLLEDSLLYSCDKGMVNLNQLFLLGNKYRAEVGLPAFQIAAFLRAKGTMEYIAAAKEEWNLQDQDLIVRPTNGTGCTMVHISIAVLAAASMNVKLHAKLHRRLIESETARFVSTGGTEFKNLNASIDQYLPGRDGRDNKGVFIQIAKALRTRVLGTDDADGWNAASVAQTHERYEVENKLCDLLRLGLVRDYDHLKELVSKI